MEEEIRKNDNEEQRAKSKEQRTENKEQRSKIKEQLVTSQLHYSLNEVIHHSLFTKRSDFVRRSLWRRWGEQRAEIKEQRSKNREQRAENKEQLVTSQLHCPLNEMIHCSLSTSYSY